MQSNLHRVAGEEFLEIPLSGRVCEVPNIETTPFSCTGNNSLVFGGVGGLAACGIVGCKGSNAGIG